VSHNHAAHVNKRRLLVPPPRFPVWNLADNEGRFFQCMISERHGLALVELWNQLLALGIVLENGEGGLSRVGTRTMTLCWWMSGCCMHVWSSTCWRSRSNCLYRHKISRIERRLRPSERVTRSMKAEKHGEW